MNLLFHPQGMAIPCTFYFAISFLSLLFLLPLILTFCFHLFIVQIPCPLTLVLRSKSKRLRAQEIAKIITLLGVQVHFLILRNPNKINHPREPQRRRWELAKIFNPLRLVHLGFLALPPGPKDHHVALAGAHAPEYVKWVDVGVYEVWGRNCAVLND